MNYREKLRENIKCPQFGDITYGRLGSLKYEDRKSIKRLLDEMDRADEVIKKQYFEIDKYKIVSDKIKEYITTIDTDYAIGCWNKDEEFVDVKKDILELLEEIE